MPTSREPAQADRPPSSDTPPGGKTGQDETVPAPPKAPPPTAEHARLENSADDLSPWRLWGPYAAGRQWGTVREDYSDNGDAWDYFPFDHAHRRAYRWGEDGIGVLCDRYGFFNIGLALWNGNDDRLKERYFGLTNAEGNHGEDAKEYWWHLDATPSHSYASMLYRYPHAAYPYQHLRQENGRRTRQEPEFELADTGILAEDRFFDITITHAKAAHNDIVIEYRARNCGPEPAPLDLIPQLWYRNTWSWGRDPRTPTMSGHDLGGGRILLETEHAWLGKYLAVADGAPQLLFCDNETNMRALYGEDSAPQPAHPKDAIDSAIVHGDRSALSPAPSGTKVGLHYHFDAIEPGAQVSVRLRLAAPRAVCTSDDFPDLAAELIRGIPKILEQRGNEADEFYRHVIPTHTTTEDATIARRAFAGLLWGKQLYRYDVREWLNGDPGYPPPSRRRASPEPVGRNTAWSSLSLADIISMPDEWEYPWFASWDLAFHCVAMAHIDPAFAKEQLVLMCREWAMHPNGQLPAYEWNFSDVNPPVHAWAAWRVYLLDGGTDHEFLVRVFTKLLLNFGWWVNRKDTDGSYLFEGGFLGMDNIGPFDRSAPLPAGQRLEQSDATSWMAFYCLGMLTIALELARENPAWDESATKFLEHYLSIAEAMENFGSENVSLWDEDDGFFYDVVIAPHGDAHPVRVRSMSGLLPLLGVATATAGITRELPDFTRRLGWLLKRRPDITDAVVHSKTAGGDVTTLTVVTPQRLHRILSRLLDENEFLGPHGIRALSAVYRGGARIDLPGQNDLTIAYTPAESDTGLFGGNSNWRGPVWFPVNTLLTDALRTYATGLGHDMSAELPSGSGHVLSIRQVADNLEERLISLFRVGPNGRRPGDPAHLPTGPLWGAAHPTFSEYFDGDTGAGVGASHQTGWTAMVAHLICSRISPPDTGAPATESETRIATA